MTVDILVAGLSLLHWNVVLSAAIGTFIVMVMTLSRHNPPFTPWFLRRNEIWLTVDAATPGDAAR